MRSARGVLILSAVIWLAGMTQPASAQTLEALPPVAPAESRALILSLEDAKQRALQNSKVLNLALLNVQSKGYATSATRADYFPKIVGSVLYFHFNNPLGQVLTTRGGANLPINVLNQNTVFSTVGVAQPITALLKVHAGVQIGEADEAIAQAQREQASRAIAVGTEQLYWGLLAARQIKAGATTAVEGAQFAAKTAHPEAVAAPIEARQGEAAAADQVADVEEQLWILLDLPIGTNLGVIEPPLPTIAVCGAQDAALMAETVSPELREAAQNIKKAEAAICAARVDFYPNLNVVGGYANQNGVPSIQQNFGYLGAQGSYTFFEWGKRRATMAERETMLSMAQVKLRQTQDEVRQKAMKAFREYLQTRTALGLAQEMARLRADAERTASGPVAQANAVKARMLADVEVVKANLAFHMAAAELGSILDCPCSPMMAARPTLEK